MASINQLFTTMISEGVDSINGISDPKDKALAYAEMAKAIALTGLVSLGEQPSIIPEKEDLEEKAKPAKAKKTKAQPVAEEVTEEEPAVEETATPEEWTEEAIEMMSTEFEALSELFEEYEEESLDDVVNNFSNGVMTSIHEITPLNVKAFLAYIDMIVNGEAEEA